jgi:hypothetical protein
MGYTLRIGNAVPEFNKDYFPELYATWTVGGQRNEDAPAFGDPSDYCNERSPSYSIWSDFCEEVGIYDVFYNERGHLHASHPGCIGITPEDLETVQKALKNRQESATLPAGFEKGWTYDGPANFDYHLARLIWLEYWMRWALENCETPAISNS